MATELIYKSSRWKYVYIDDTLNTKEIFFFFLSLF